MFEHATRHAEDSTVAVVLVEMSMDGWELVSVSPRPQTGYQLFFKRRRNVGKSAIETVPATEIKGKR